MSEIKDGGPAFPSPACGDWLPEYGMSLRDFIAAQNVPRIFEHHMADGETTVEQAAKVAAIWSYAIADAMLSARSGESA